MREFLFLSYVILSLFFFQLLLFPIESFNVTQRLVVTPIPHNMKQLAHNATSVKQFKRLHNVNTKQKPAKHGHIVG